MNLLALLERRMPPQPPRGAGRVFIADSEPPVVKPQREQVRGFNPIQQAHKQQSRANILAAIGAGLHLSEQLVASTGLCKSSVHKHCAALVKEGLIEVTRGSVVNTYALAKPATKGAP